jgi:hypothetical protein
LKLTRVEQSGYLRQFLLVRLDDEECFFDALVLGTLALSGNGDHAASRLKQAPRALQSFTTNRIEHDIDISDEPAKWVAHIETPGEPHKR